MAVHLKHRNGGWTLAPGDHILGRDDACQLLIDDPRVSRQHARVTLTADGHLVIADLGSSNGILVNGDALFGEIQLDPGDQIAVGPYLLTMASDDAATPGATSGKVRVDEELTADLMPSTDRQNRSTMEMDPGIDLDRPLTRSADTQQPATAAAVSTGTADQENHSDPPSETDLDAPSVWNSSDNEMALTEQRRREASRRVPAVTPDSGLHPTKATPAASDDSALANQQAEATVRRKNSTTDRLAPSKVRATGTEALLPKAESQRLRATLRRIRLPRALAGALDPLCAACLAVIPMSIVLIAAVMAGFLLAGPQITETGSLHFGRHAEQASITDLLTWLLRSATPGTLSEALSTLRATNQQAFLVIFAGATLAVICAVLVLVFVLVAPTCIKGAPFWHRRMGLIISERATGYHPTATRAFCRWLLLAVLWPVALCAGLLGRLGPHDWAVGCHIRRADDSEPPAAQS